MEKKIKFDSKEELYFSWWLDELIQEDIIIDYVAQPDSFVLTKAVERPYIKKMKRVEDKELTETLIREKVYSPDFKLYWNLGHPNIDKFVGDLSDRERKHSSVLFKSRFLTKPSEICFVEIKGSYDNNNMTRLFLQNQAFVWEKHKEWVNLIKIPNLFKKTFTPKRYLLTDKTKKPRKIKFPAKTLKDFLEFS